MSLRLEHIQSGGKRGSSAYFSFLFTVFRVFTVGIGSGVSSSLINGVARAGNGKAEFIMGKDRIQPKVNYNYKIILIKIPRKCQNQEAQPFGGFKSRRDEEQIR